MTRSDPVYTKKWRAANPEKCAEYAEKRRHDPIYRAEDRARHNQAYAANPNKYWLRNLKRRTGITEQVYVMMAQMQDHKCAICRSTKPTHNNKYFTVDHDHQTRLIRGLLCGMCNTGLGHFRDNPVLLLLACGYLCNEAFTDQRKLLKNRSVRVPRTNQDQKYAYDIKYRFDLSWSVYVSLLKFQKNRCAICMTCKPGNGKSRFGVDHDHKTGAIRGLLCGPCNTGAGMFQDDPAVLMAAVEYLRTHGS